MSHSSKVNTFVIPLIVSIAVGGLTSYFVANSILTPKSPSATGQIKNPTDSEKSQNQVKVEEIEKILVDFLKRKPDIFMNSINEGLQTQQDKVKEGIEKLAEEKKEKILEMGVFLGSKSAPLKVISFIDPLCPHCHEFIKMSLFSLKKRQDLAVIMIPVAVMGENSAVVSRFMIAAAEQGIDKFQQLIQNFIKNINNNLDQQKFLKLVEDSGLDVKKFEKDIASKKIVESLMENGKVFEELKLQGVPSILVRSEKAPFKIIPPMEINTFLRFLDSLKIPE